MKNKKTIITIASAMLMTTALNSAVFNNYAKAQDINTNLLANNVDGKLMLKADIGYVYSFAGDWNKSNAESPSIGGNKSAATGGVGYGASLGYTHKSGLGLSADYLGFNHKWTGLGTDVNLKTEFNYDASYHVVTLVPSYRIKLDAANNWGLRVGLGVGFSLSDVNWAQKISTGAQQNGGAKIASGAIYKDNNATYTSINQRGVGLIGVVSFANNATPAIDSNCTFGIYSDQKGASSAIDYGNLLGGGNTRESIGVVAVRANGCLSTAFATATNGANVIIISDADIAKHLNNGKISFLAADANTQVSYDVWKDVFGANATTAGVNTLLTADAFGTGTAVTMNGTTWGTLSYDQQNTLHNAGLVTNAITAAPPSSGGSAKDDAGFVLAPQVALEYDNGMLHADINVKYIHELFNVRYFGSEGSVDGLAKSGAITYTSIAGPLALFVGAGFGMNF